MNYPSIRIEGAILSPDILERIEDTPGQKPSDFGFESSTKVKDEIARAWADAQDYWRIFHRKLEALRPDSPATTETRQQWAVPLLGMLGNQLEYQARGVELNGKIYSISHRAANRAQCPVQITGYREPAGLDRKSERANLRMSAHAVVQEYINLTDQLYGIVTNGRLLRLLRDSSRLIKLSYLEFDLDRIFTDGLFADFAVLYRLLHVSRLPVSNEAGAESWIELYHQDSLDSGARIREGLSRAVEHAIRDFGTGFLAHPTNEALQKSVASRSLSPEDYYKALAAADLSPALPDGDRRTRPCVPAESPGQTAGHLHKLLQSAAASAPVRAAVSRRPAQARSLAGAPNILPPLRSRWPGGEAGPRPACGRSLRPRGNRAAGPLHPRQ